MANPLDSRWLDALQILRRHQSDVRTIAATYVPDYGMEPFPLHAVTLSPEPVGVVEDRDIFRLTIHPQILYLPRIEQVEILLYAATIASVHMRTGTNPLNGRFTAMHEQLCRNVGCYWENVPDIRERWRLIDFFSPAHLLPLAVFETRPLCSVCKQPVATDAGAWVKQIPDPKIGPFLTPEQVRALDPDTIAYQDFIHGECARYAHKMVSEFKAAQQATEEVSR